MTSNPFPPPNCTFLTADSRVLRDDSLGRIHTHIYTVIMASKFEELARSMTAQGESQKLPGLAVLVADDAGMSLESLSIERKN